jgi:hypothetical protein
VYDDKHSEAVGHVANALAEKFGFSFFALVDEPGEEPGMAAGATVVTEVARVAVDALREWEADRDVPSWFDSGKPSVLVNGFEVRFGRAPS